MPATVTIIDAIRPHGDNLSIVSVMGHEVVANRKEDGEFRWEAGEQCVYVSEGVIIPDDVLQERGYWNAEKNKGLLGGSKGNRVKMQRFAGHESRGLLFKLRPGSFMGVKLVFIDRANHPTQGGEHGSGGAIALAVQQGNDVMEFLSMTEFEG